MLSLNTVWIALSVYAGVLLVHAAWRSRGDAAQDPIRDSGPIL